MSPTWDPNGPLVHTPLQTLNMNCYSSWNLPMDISSRIVSGIASSTYTNHVPMMALSGYYGTKSVNMFHSTHEHYPWVQYEFDAVVTLTKVIVATRNYPAWQPNEFDKVKAKLGNVSQPSGDFTSFASLGLYGSYSGSGAIIVYHVTPPLAGKYLAFKCKLPTKRHLLIGDIKVIGF